MSAGVHCPFFMRGALRGVSSHWALSARRPQGRDSGNRLELTQCTHHCPIRCALRVRIPSHLLSSCSTTTELRRTTGCVSPDSVDPNHFGPDEHAPPLRHRAPCHESAGSALILYHCASTLILSRDRARSLRDLPVRRSPGSVWSPPRLERVPHSS